VVTILKLLMGNLLLFLLSKKQQHRTNNI